MISGPTCGCVKLARYAATTLTAKGWLGGNHAMPSFTSASRSVYAPTLSGARTVAVPVTLVPGATTVPPAPMDERRPSHTTTAPVASYQWYASATWPLPARISGGPKSSQVSSPVFVSVTGTFTSVAAPVDAGIVAWYVADSGTAGCPASAAPVCERSSSAAAAATSPFLITTRLATTSGCERHRTQRSRPEPRDPF